MNLFASSGAIFLSLTFAGEPSSDWHLLRGGTCDPKDGAHAFHADFDGNGKSDEVRLEQKGVGPNQVERVIVFMNGEKKPTVIAETAKNAEHLDFLALGKAGAVLAAFDGSGKPLKTAHDYFIYGHCAAWDSSVYWDSAQKTFVTVHTGD